MQWELFIRHVVEGARYRWTLREGAKGVQLVEAGAEVVERSALGRPAALSVCSYAGPSLEPTLQPPWKRCTGATPLPDRDAGPCRARSCSRAVAFNRIAFSAAHVVADARAAIDPWLDCAVDWDATLAYREHLWALGLGVAEAMDTAQRGMGLDWPTSLELIRRSLDAGEGRARARWPGFGLRHRPSGAGRRQPSTT